MGFVGLSGDTAVAAAEVRRRDRGSAPRTRRLLTRQLALMKQLDEMAMSWVRIAELLCEHSDAQSDDGPGGKPPKGIAPDPPVARVSPRRFSTGAPSRAPEGAVRLS